MEVVDNLAHLVVRVSENVPLKVGQMLTTLEVLAYERAYPGGFEAATGAEGLKKRLAALDLEALSEELWEELDRAVSQMDRRGSSTAWKWWSSSAARGTVPRTWASRAYLSFLRPSGP